MQNFTNKKKHALFPPLPLPSATLCPSRSSKSLFLCHELHTHHTARSHLGSLCMAPILDLRHRTGRLSEHKWWHYRKQLDTRSTLKSQACRFTYFHLLSRGSEIRNNQNPAGNNIWHLNWVGCATDVSNVSIGRSFFYYFFFFNTKNSFTFMVHLFSIALLQAS